MKKKDSTEFDNFDRTMRELMKVPHDEIKAELDKEKTLKVNKKKDKKKDDHEESSS
jgi:hypothetical protein